MGKEDIDEGDVAVKQKGVPLLPSEEGTREIVIHIPEEDAKTAEIGVLSFLAILILLAAAVAAAYFVYDRKRQQKIKESMDKLIKTEEGSKLPEPSPPSPFPVSEGESSTPGVTPEDDKTTVTASETPDSEATTEATSGEEEEGSNALPEGSGDSNVNAARRKRREKHRDKAKQDLELEKKKKPGCCSCRGLCCVAPTAEPSLEELWSQKKAQDKTSRGRRRSAGEKAGGGLHRRHHSRRGGHRRHRKKSGNLNLRTPVSGGSRHRLKPSRSGSASRLYYRRRSQSQPASSSSRIRQKSFNKIRRVWVSDANRSCWSQADHPKRSLSLSPALGARSSSSRRRLQDHPKDRHHRHGVGHRSRREFSANRNRSGRRHISAGNHSHPPRQRSRSTGRVHLGSKNRTRNDGGGGGERVHRSHSKSFKGFRYYVKDNLEGEEGASLLTVESRQGNRPEPKRIPNPGERNHNTGGRDNGIRHRESLHGRNYSQNRSRSGGKSSSMIRSASQRRSSSDRRRVQDDHRQKSSSSRLRLLSRNNANLHSKPPLHTGKVTSQQSHHLHHHLQSRTNVEGSQSRRYFQKGSQRPSRGLALLPGQGYGPQSEDSRADLGELESPTMSLGDAADFQERGAEGGAVSKRYQSGEASSHAFKPIPARDRQDMNQSASRYPQHQHYRHQTQNVPRLPPPPPPPQHYHKGNTSSHAGPQRSNYYDDDYDYDRQGNLYHHHHRHLNKSQNYNGEDDRDEPSSSAPPSSVQQQQQQQQQHHHHHQILVPVGAGASNQQQSSASGSAGPVMEDTGGYQNDELSESDEDEPQRKKRKKVCKKRRNHPRLRQASSAWAASARDPPSSAGGSEMLVMPGCSRAYSSSSSENCDDAGAGLARRLFGLRLISGKRSKQQGRGQGQVKRKKHSPRDWPGGHGGKGRPFLGDEPDWESDDDDTDSYNASKDSGFDISASFPSDSQRARVLFSSTPTPTPQYPLPPPFSLCLARPPAGNAPAAGETTTFSLPPPPSQPTHSYQLVRRKAQKNSSSSNSVVKRSSLLQTPFDGVAEEPLRAFRQDLFVAEESKKTKTDSDNRGVDSCSSHPETSEPALFQYFQRLGDSSQTTGPGAKLLGFIRDDQREFRKLATQKWCEQQQQQRMAVVPPEFSTHTSAADTPSLEVDSNERSSSSLLPTSASIGYYTAPSLERDSNQPSSSSSSTFFQHASALTRHSPGKGSSASFNFPRLLEPADQNNDNRGCFHLRLGHSLDTFASSSSSSSKTFRRNPPDSDDRKGEDKDEEKEEDAFFVAMDRMDFTPSSNTACRVESFTPQKQTHIQPTKFSAEPFSPDWEETDMFAQLAKSRLRHHGGEEEENQERQHQQSGLHETHPKSLHQHQHHNYDSQFQCHCQSPDDFEPYVAAFREYRDLRAVTSTHGTNRRKRSASTETHASVDEACRLDQAQSHDLASTSVAPSGGGRICPSPPYPSSPSPRSPENKGRLSTSILPSKFK